MLNLNLPPFDYKVKKSEGKLWIFDVIRKKYVVLIPEEWVRQHFIHMLIQKLQYPRSLIRVEGGVMFNSLQKRSDILVYDRNTKPWMVIECKAPNVKVDDSTVFQASVYNKTLQAKYLVVTNGLVHLYYHIDWHLSTTTKLHSMPGFEE